VRGSFAPIIERGAVLPISRVERFATLGDGQTRLLLEVYQGEHSLCDQNQKLGQYKTAARSRPRAKRWSASTQSWTRPAPERLAWAEERS
jgi:molecular chaperone DnaK (HSP70)